MDWRSGKLFASRDPPFTRPQPMHEEGEEEEEDHVPPARRTTVPSTPNSYDNDNSSQSPFADSNRYTLHSQLPASTPSAYTPAPQAAGRPSMDVYGAFSDPAPSGFGTSRYNQVPSSYTNSYSTASPARSNTGPPTLPEPDLGPMVSRTMQYADPYAAVRASIAGQQGSGSPTSTLPMPPSYESYEGYR